MNWVRCHVCDEELDEENSWDAHRCAYGWICTKCVEEISPAEFRALCTMSDLANELVANKLVL